MLARPPVFQIRRPRPRKRHDRQAPLPTPLLLIPLIWMVLTLAVLRAVDHDVSPRNTSAGTAHCTIGACRQVSFKDESEEQVRDTATGQGARSSTQGSRCVAPASRARTDGWMLRPAAIRCGIIADVATIHAAHSFVGPGRRSFRRSIKVIMNC